MIDNASAITPKLQFYYQIRALTHQKNILSGQICQLLSSTKKIDSIVEIGTPATYIASIKDRVEVNGKVYVIHDKKRSSDVVQSFRFNPFKKFLGYDEFVELNNYDPISEDIIPSNSVDVIICVIGLHHIPQEKLDPFITSIRRILKPNGQFILRDHNVINSDVESIVYAAHSVFNVIMNQDSLETELAEYRNFQALDYWIQLVERIGFKVSPERLVQQGDPTFNTMIKFTKIAQNQEEREIELHAALQKNPTYVRDSMQTYLTTPEWFNVDTAQEYGQFIEHTPFYEYPYLHDLQTYWKVFRNAWQQAAREKGHLAIATSPYTAMNLFIGIMMSVEYGAKGLISLPIKWVYSGEEPGVIQLLVKDQESELPIINDSRIKVIGTYESIGIKLIEIPRYKQFSDIVLKLAGTNVSIVEIAGNSTIQIKVRYMSDQQRSIYFDMEGCEKLYTWEMKSKPDTIYAALKVNIKNLKQIIKFCQKNGVEIIYIHDF
jgi:SAM-dependent methyltransferase